MDFNFYTKHWFFKKTKSGASLKKNLSDKIRGLNINFKINIWPKI